MRKGDILESDYSKEMHQLGVPALISPLLLRSLNLGQIDVAYIQKASDKKWLLKIIESKSSLSPPKGQMFRLRKTQDYLSRVLEMEALLEVKFCKKDDLTLFF